MTRNERHTKFACELANDRLRDIGDLVSSQMQIAATRFHSDTGRVCITCGASIARSI